MITKSEINRMWLGYRAHVAKIGGPHYVFKSFIGGSVSPEQREMLKERLRLKADAGLPVRSAERSKRMLAADWDRAVERIHGRF
jgi:hypothetical protein